MQTLRDWLTRPRSSPPKCTLIETIAGQSSTLQAQAALLHGGDSLGWANDLERQAQRLRDAMGIQRRMLAGGGRMSVPLLCSELARLLEASSVTFHVVVHKSMCLEVAFSSDPTPEPLEPGDAALLQHARQEPLRVTRGGRDLLLLAVCAADGEAIGLVEAARTSPASPQLGADAGRGGARSRIVPEAGGEGEGGRGAFGGEEGGLLSLLAPLAEPALLARRQEMYEALSASAALRRRSSGSGLTLGESGGEVGQLPLLELMGGVAGQLEVEPLIAHIRAAAKAVMRAELCTVFLVSDDRQSLIGRTSDEEGGEPFAVPLHTGLAGFAAISGEVLNLADAQADERFNGAMDRKTGRRTRSVLCMPIVDDENRVIGVCQCVNKLGGGGAIFRREEEALLSALCRVFAVCVKNATLFAKEGSLRRRHEALVEASHILSTKLELPALVKAMRSAVCAVMAAERCTLFLVKKDELAFNLSEDEGGALCTLPLGRGVAGHCAMHNKRINLADAGKDARFDRSIDLRTGSHTRNLLALPIPPICRLTGGVIEGAPCLGVLQVMNKRGGAFTAEDEALLHGLCCQLSVAVANATLFAEVSESRVLSQAVFESTAGMLMLLSADDGSLLQSNKPLRELFPATDEQRMRTTPGVQWLREAGEAGEALAADVKHVATEGGCIDRPKARDFGRGDAGRPPRRVSWTVTALHAAARAPSPPSPDRAELELGRLGGSRLGILVTLRDETREWHLERALGAAQDDAALLRSVTGSLLAVAPSSRRSLAAAEGVPVDAVACHLDALLGASAATSTSGAPPNAAQPADEAAIGDGTARGTDAAEHLRAVRQLLSLPDPSAEARYDEARAALRRAADPPHDPAASLAALGGAAGPVPLLAWGLDLHAHPRDETELLMSHGLALFTASGLTAALALPAEGLLRLLVEIGQSYLPNPFHNFRHGLMVAHKVWLIVGRSALGGELLSRAEVLALLLAAVAHDAGHLGRTNAFECASGSPLALQYNDKSPLENLHTATLFRLLAKHDVLAFCPREQRAQQRRLIIDAISATDLAHHDALLAQLEAMPPLRPAGDAAARRAALAAGGASGSAPPTLEPQQRTLLVQAVLHAADLYTPTLPWEASLRWVRALGEEFRAQVELERAHGLPESSFLLHKDLRAQARSELFFVGRFVAPLWAAMARLVPQLKPCEAMLLDNVSLWQKVADGAPLGELDTSRQLAISRAWEEQPLLGFGV